MRVSNLTEKIDAVKRTIEEACLRSGRVPQDVLLVAVTKRFPEEVVEAAWENGLRAFGENYVQEGVKKIQGLKEKGITPEWHLIGHLQKNKARQAIRHFDWIETVDSKELLGRISRIAQEEKRRIRCLIQVNISMDPGKSGILPGDVEDILRYAANLEDSPVSIEGLMTITRYSQDPEAARKWFRALRELRDTIMESGTLPFNLKHLSMGMSNDYPVAIEEGATIVRVGQALFGPRE